MSTTLQHVMKSITVIVQYQIEDMNCLYMAFSCKYKDLRLYDQKIMITAYKKQLSLWF